MKRLEKDLKNLEDINRTERGLKVTKRIERD
jgi:hypothetical protein